MIASVRARFAFTVGANVFRSLLSFSTGMLLARSLGPSTYGNMAFLLGTFLGIQQLLDMGSSTAFFTFLSQKPRSKRFVRSFFAWLTLQFLFLQCVVGLMFPSKWVETIWHGEPRGLVLLAFAAAFMQSNVWPVVQQAGESQRQTVRVQSIGVAVVGAHLLAVVLLWWLGALGLYAIFAAIALEYLLAAFMAHRRFPYAEDLNLAQVGGEREPILRKYFDYCLPIIPYSYMVFASEFADRWLLQNYGGGVQQAYYAVGAQLAGIALLATTSILRIFWKEIAEAYQRADHGRTRMLYQRVSRLLFLIGSIIAGFLIPWAEDLLRLILGAAYVGGAATLAIMLLYPIHQSMGQICGTMLYATERVSIVAMTGIIFMALGIATTYLVLAPGNAVVPGLGLASEGLAIKMVAVQILSVNLIGYLIARISNWPFDWVYQPVSLLGCVGLGFMANHSATLLLGQACSVSVVMGIGGIFYLAMIAAFLYAMPWLAGMTHSELFTNARRAWKGAMRLVKH
jgi:O-antigen/teichoic acid export membrane protein